MAELATVMGRSSHEEEEDVEEEEEDEEEDQEETESRAPTTPAVLYEAPPPRQRAFASWEHFDRFLDEYGRATFQLFRKRTSTSVKLRNRRMAERAAAASAKRRRVLAARGLGMDADRSPSPLGATTAAVPFIPEKYGNYSVTLVCTHSGEYVPRGTGKRSRQDVRATRCDAQVNACLKLADPARDEYHVVVTRAVLAHNHRVDRETFLQYSQSRLNLSDALTDSVELMRRTGVKPKDIRSYIVTHSACAPTVKDVQNLLTRLKHQADAADAADAAADAEQQHRAAQLTPLPAGSTGFLVSGQQDGDDTSSRLATAFNDQVQPMQQFQVADSVGRRIAHLLAGLPSDEFAGAVHVLGLAETIIHKRRQEASDSSTDSPPTPASVASGSHVRTAASMTTADAAAMPGQLADRNLLASTHRSVEGGNSFMLRSPPRVHDQVQMATNIK